VNRGEELAKVSTLTFSQIKTTGTIAICKFSKLMVTSPKAVLRGYDWLDTLAHEYVHLVVSQKSRNTVPIWLHEGMAKYLESRWRGQAGQALSLSSLALLGSRVQKNKLIPFEKMHPSIAMLPTAQDAATAFAEVFFAIDMVVKEHGVQGLQTIIRELSQGKTDKQAVEAATSKTFAQFERAWLSHVKRQPFPKDRIPFDDERPELKEGSAKKDKPAKKDKEISYGELAEIAEVEPRKMAHLGELMRERGRFRAAVEEYGKAYQVVGARYQSLSDKYALALLETRDYDGAKKVLSEALKIHPDSASMQVHLGRAHLWTRNFPEAKKHYLDALASDPFDEEIHLALVRIHEAMGDEKLTERAVHHVVILTGLDKGRVRDAARAMAKENARPGATQESAPQQSAPVTPAAGNEPTRSR
jgi:tetratricopeptide (TPR) repeat protein